MFLFRKKKQANSNGNQSASNEQVREAAQSLPPDIKTMMDQRYQNLSEMKEISEPISQQELLKIFGAYFAPNFDFYAMPGSEKYKAYFACLNAAKEEMIKSKSLFTKATKWSTKQLVDLINNPIPGITNSMICGLIFRIGEYSVLKDSLYCVDFSEQVPNCIGMYLLLIAHREPPKNRTQKLDIGDNANKKPLSKVLNSLQILDPDWKCQIVWPQ